jgi:hypothetical protein
MKRIKRNPRGLTVTDVAQLTGMTRQAIHYNINAGYLPAVKDSSGKYQISWNSYWLWKNDFYRGDDVKDDPK